MASDTCDEVLAAYALNLWANWIETGDVALSASDAKQAGRPFNAPTLDQMRLIVRLRDLAHGFNQKALTCASRPSR